MLRWYLSTRGYKTSTHEQNKRALYILIKLESYEGLYLSHTDGILRSDIWQAWLEVLKVDFEISEFRSIWPAAKRFYAKPFVNLVDDILHET